MDIGLKTHNSMSSHLNFVRVECFISTLFINNNFILLKTISQPKHPWCKKVVAKNLKKAMLKKM